MVSPQLEDGHLGGGGSTSTNQGGSGNGIGRGAAGLSRWGGVTGVDTVAVRVPLVRSLSRPGGAMSHRVGDDGTVWAKKVRHRLPGGGP